MAHGLSCSETCGSPQNQAWIPCRVPCTGRHSTTEPPGEPPVWFLDCGLLLTLFPCPKSPLHLCLVKPSYPEPGHYFQEAFSGRLHSTPGLGECTSESCTTVTQLTTLCYNGHLPTRSWTFGKNLNPILCPIPLCTPSTRARPNTCNNSCWMDLTGLLCPVHWTWLSCPSFVGFREVFISAEKPQKNSLPEASWGSPPLVCHPGYLCAVSSWALMQQIWSALLDLSLGSGWGGAVGWAIITIYG